MLGEGWGGARERELGTRESCDNREPGLQDVVGEMW